MTSKKSKAAAMKQRYFTPKNMLLLLVLIAVIVAIAYLETSKPDQADIVVVEGAGEVNSIAPELVGNQQWINSEPLTIKELTEQDKVVLVDFWTYTCINCIRTLPYLEDWHEKYADDGLVILGVHTPEFAFEEEYENVVAAAEKYNLQYPIVQDNDYATWRAYSNRYWPAKYLIDKDGIIRYRHFGEGKYAETEEMIQELLAEAGSNVDEEISADQIKQNLPRTPELYAGYNFALPRGQNVGNPGGLKVDQEFDYNLPEDGKIVVDTLYLNGKWRSNQDNIKALEEGSTILLAFQGSEVNFVADGNAEVEVIVNGLHISPDLAGSDVEFTSNTAVVNVNEPRLYNLFSGEHGRYLLTLTTNQPDLEVSAFTFG